MEVVRVEFGSDFYLDAESFYSSRGIRPQNFVVWGFFSPNQTRSNVFLNRCEGCADGVPPNDV